MKSTYYIDARLSLDVSLKVSAGSKEEAIDIIMDYLESEVQVQLREPEHRSNCAVEEIFDKGIEILDDLNG